MKNIFQKCLTLIFSLFALLNFTYAQLEQIPKDPVSVHSPNATSLGMYGEVPVSYFTGIPNIEIPIYTLKEKEISVPISLSYHASGFRPDQHPGWVGNGWSLQAGGVISRIVHRLPDDDNEAFDNSGHNTALGFYFQHSDLNISNWSNSNFIRDTIMGGTNLNYFLDTEPDEFDFNFAGYSGKFYMDYNGVYHAVGDKGIQITLINPNQPIIPCLFSPPTQPVTNDPYSIAYLSSFAGFIIKTTDGTQYVFGGDGNSIEYSKSFFQQNSTSWIADSWYLTKIIGPDGSQVTFSYQRGPFINQIVNSVTQASTSTQVQNPNFSSNIFYINPPTCSNTSGGVPKAGLYSGKLISPLYLSQISSEQSTINFTKSSTQELTVPSYVYPFSSVGSDCSGTNYYYCPDNFFEIINSPNGTLNLSDAVKSLTWEELDNIQIVKNDNNQVLKQFNFTYTHDQNQRLTLLNLQEQSGTGLSIPPYRFYYDNSYTLPGYLSAQVDHWGFWDGRTAVLFNSNSTIDAADYFSYREPDPTYATAGILNKIIYPTSAVTNFQFEPHTYSAEVDIPRWLKLLGNSADKYAGGLRIRKITTTDPLFLGQSKSKEYFYIQNYSPSTGFTGRSSGNLGSKAKYYWTDYAVNQGANQITLMTVFSTQSALPASENSMGSHIGYSEVIEKSSDGEVTQYKYTNFDNGHMDDPYISTLQPQSSPYASYNSKDFERGKLLSENVYSAAGIPLKSIVYSYTAQATDPIRSLMMSEIFTCGGGVLNYKTGTAYNFYIYPYLPTSKTTTVFDSNGLNPQAITQNTTYESLHSFVRQETVTDSKGRLTTTSYRYPFDVLFGTPLTAATVNTPLSYMVNNNIIGSPIETIKSKLINGNDNIIAASVKLFKGVSITAPAGVNTSTVKPALDYFFESISPLLKTSYVPYNTTVNGTVEQTQIDPNMKPRIEYSNYDTRGNIVQFNDNATNIATPSQYFPHYNSYMWGYSQLFPIAIIANAGNSSLTTEFYAENFEENPISGVTSGSAHTGSKYLLAPSFTVNWAPPNSRGYVISYWYKSSGVWKYSGEIPYTSTSYNISVGDGAYDDIRVYPADAQMSTYTYDKLIGLTSSIDPKGSTMYYEYDDFQRLMNIKNVNNGITSIVKSYVYNYPNSINQSANYQDDNNKRCVLDGNGNTTGVQQQEQVDINPASLTYNSTQFRSLGVTGACPVTVTFTITNNSASGFSATFSGGPSGNVNISIAPNTVIRQPLVIYNNYTLIISPSGSPVTRTFTLGQRAGVPAPGTTFNAVNVGTGTGAEVTLSIN